MCGTSFFVTSIFATLITLSQFNELVMSGCRNAYIMSNFGSGMSGLCLSDQHGSSVIRAGHEVSRIRPDENPCVTAVVTFPLRSIEGVATALKQFRELTIDFDTYA